jgi:hypothetical protein
MNGDGPAAPWLLRAARIGWLALFAAVAGLAGALLLGLADPPRAGPLLWDSRPGTDLGRWTLVASDGGVRFAEQGDALVIEFTAPGQLAFAVTDAPAGDFTLEAGAASAAPGDSAAYGLVFGWLDEQNYSAILVSSSGYSEGYTREGDDLTPWYGWQQWPHILGGTDGNRVRVDARGGRATARINDEYLAEAEGLGTGRIGVAARGGGAGRVVFSYVRVWARP